MQLSIPSIATLLRMTFVTGIPAAESTAAYEKHFAGVVGNTQHTSKDADVSRAFYNLATEFYEYGWGDSFHFGWRHKNEPHRMSIFNAQVHLATKLGVKDGSRVLDMGCGIGGPMRAVVRFTGANVTGLTINEHQVSRAREITSKLPRFMQERCSYNVQDYLHVDASIAESAYDAAFYMESSLHCKDRTRTFSETYRLLRPGGRLVALEYVTLDGWKPADPYHAEMMAKHIQGNGASETPSVGQAISMVREAGFEILEHYDYMALGRLVHGEDEFPWWADLRLTHQGLWPTLLPAHPWVRTTLNSLLWVLSSLNLVPTDVYRAAVLMDIGGDGLSALGELGAISPQYTIVAVKPAVKPPA